MKSLQIRHCDRSFPQGAAATSREEIYRLSLENVTELISVLDCSARELYSSPSWRAARIQPQPDTGDWFAPIYSEDRQRGRECFRTILLTSQPQRVEFRLLREDGAICLAESRWSVAQGQDGRVSHV